MSLGGRTESGMDNEKINLSKSYKGWEVVESLDHLHPEATRYIKEESIFNKWLRCNPKYLSQHIYNESWIRGINKDSKKEAVFDKVSFGS